MRLEAPLFYDRDLIGRTLLGRYQIVRRLGSGGMGIVYLATMKGAAGFVKPAVVKLILPSFVSNQTFSAMFAREARILSCLKDPAIVDVIDFAEENGVYVMVLEYVHGYQLRQWFKYLKSKDRLIPASVCIQIVITICDALHHAHTIKAADGSPMQVIHRDVSTPNILLDTDGRIKLVDFGIARISGKSQEYVTQEHTFKGKFNYAAPEILMGAEAKVSSDVYSCGVVLHEILAGENVFVGDDLVETCWRVKNLVPPSVHGYRDDAPDDIDIVIGKALAKSPTERYQSVRQFSQALRKSQTSSERETIDLLRELVRADFNEDMAAYLQVDSLQKLELSWRHPSLDPSPNIHETIPDDYDTQTALIVSPMAASSEGTSGDPDRGVKEVMVEPVIRPAIVSVATKPPIDVGDKEPSKRASSAVNIEQRTSKDSKTSVGKSVIWVSVTALLVLIAILITTEIIETNNRDLELLVVQSPFESSNSVITVTDVRKEQTPTQVGEFQIQKDVADQPASAKTTVPRKAADIPSSYSRRTAKVKSFDVQLVTRAFIKREKDIQVCFERHAADLLGKPQIIVQFEVNPTGGVERATLTPRALAKTLLGKCVLLVASSTQFPFQKEAISFFIPLTAQRTPK